MKKGFIATLVAATVIMTGSAFAKAPTILNLPDVTIGDNEERIGTDNNYFVYTNAFKLDDFVVDEDTAFTSLKWSFDEHDAFDGSETNVRWYNVNGKEPIHKQTSDILADASGAAHLDPGANDLRAVSAYASFRDVIFTPGSGALTSPFASPVDPEKTRHANGKFVRFYVSDGFSVATKECFVKTVDNASDAVSGGSQFVQTHDTTFTADPTQPPGSTTGWSTFTQQTDNLAKAEYNATADVLDARIWRDPGYPAQTRYRTSGWVANLSDWLPYQQVGSTNYVRVKYYMYAHGQSTTAANVIPNIRLRAQTRFAVNSMLEVLHHDNADPEAQTFAYDVRPSTNPAKPSLYRVDLDPVDVPYLVSNGSVEGIQRAFEAYTFNPQDDGYIAMVESVMGVYPVSALDDSRALTGGTKIYQPSASDAGDLKIYNTTTDLQKYNLALGTVEGAFAPYSTGTTQGTYTEGTFGATFDTRAVPVWPVLGVLGREFDPGADLAARVRVAPNEQYKVRWHIVSAQNSNINTQIRLRARAIKFQWTQKYEVGGAWATTGVANATMAAQALPGVGCQNPDKIGTENGGWYTLLVTSPMNADIRAESTDPLSVSMPNLTKAPGRGETTVDPSAPAGAVKMRDLRLGCEVVDTLSQSGNNILEQGLFTIDKIEVRSFNLVDDGGY